MRVRFQFPHNMENFEELSKFNKPFNNQTIMKRFCFIRIGFQSVFLYGTRDYVKLFQVMKLYL
jgi:hypothetical protein